MIYTSEFIWIGLLSAVLAGGVLRTKSYWNLLLIVGLLGVGICDYIVATNISAAIWSESGEFIENPVVEQGEIIHMLPIVRWVSYFITLVWAARYWIQPSTQEVNYLFGNESGAGQAQGIK